MSVFLASRWFFCQNDCGRKLKVILHKNFYQSKYDYQEQWKKFAERMTSGLALSDIQSAILDLFCESLACKGAALYLYDYESKTYAYASSFNSRRDWRPFSEEDPLIVSLKQKEWIINLRENHPEFVNSLIESFDDIGAFLVIPLFFDEDLAGFIVLGEQIDADEILTYEDYDLLRMLARQTIATVQGLRLSEQLTTSRELACNR